MSNYFTGGCVKTTRGANTDHFTLELRKEGSLDYSNVFCKSIIEYNLGAVITMRMINAVARKYGANVSSENCRGTLNYYYRFPTLQTAQDAAAELNAKVMAMRLAGGDMKVIPGKVQRIREVYTD